MAITVKGVFDGDDIISGIGDIRREIERMREDVERSGMSIENMFENVNSLAQRVAGIAGVAFSVNQVQGFLGKVSDMRAYFQDIESSMKVFLGNEQKASQFTKELKDYAYYNMFEFKDLAMASKQMIAYKHDVDSIIPTLDKLSNIATGTNVPLLELVGSYNKAKNIGYVDSKGLGSWAAKGLVVTDVLKEMGVELDGNRVSFEQLNMAIDKVTDTGGMFHDLMLNQMTNISAESGQYEDNLASMYNEIGVQFEDIISKFYKMKSDVVENYRDIGAFGFDFGDVIDGAEGLFDFLLDNYKAIGGTILHIIALYGEWKAAQVVADFSQKGIQIATYKAEEEMLQRQIDKYKELIDIKHKNRDGDLQALVEQGKLTKEQMSDLIKKRDLAEQLRKESTSQHSKAAVNLDDGTKEKIEEYKELIKVQKEAIAANQLKDDDVRMAVQSGDISLETGKAIEARREELEMLEEEIKLYEGVALNRVSDAIDFKEKAEDYVKLCEEKKKATESHVEALQKEYDELKKDPGASEEDIEEKGKELAAAQSEDLAAATELETATEKANAAGKVANAASTQHLTLAKMSEEIATKKNTVAENTNTAATKANTTATKAGIVQKTVDAIRTKAQAFATGLFNQAVNICKNSIKALGAAVDTNPLGLLITGITVALQLFGVFDEETEDAVTSTEHFGEEVRKEIRDITTLYDIMEGAGKNTKVYKQATDELSQKMEEYGIKLDCEIDKVTQLNENRERLIELIEKETKVRQRANKMKDIDQELDANEEALNNDIKDILKNAEWDESGLFDDYDAEDIQKNSQISNIISLMTQDAMVSLEEFEKQGALTEEKIAEVQENLRRQIKGYLEEKGLSTTKKFLTAKGYYKDFELDIYDKINKKLLEHYEKYTKLIDVQNDMKKQLSELKNEEEEHAEKIDVATLSITELIEGAVNASDALEGLGDTDVEPKVNTESIEKGKEKADETKDAVSGLNMTATPIIDTTYLDEATAKAWELNLALGEYFKTGKVGGKDGIPFYEPRALLKNGTEGMTSFVFQDKEAEDMANAKRVKKEREQAQQPSRSEYVSVLQEKLEGAVTNRQIDDLRKELNASRQDFAPGSEEERLIDSYIEILNSRQGKGRKNGSKDDTAKRMADYQRRLDRERLARERAIKDMEFETRQFAIDMEKEGTEKEILQAELDFEKRKTAIERAYEDLKQKKLDKERELYEADPKNKGKLFDENSVDVSYTEEEKANHKAALDAAKHTYDEAMRRIRQEAEMSLNEFLARYGTFEQQRAAVTSNYETRIAEAKTEGERMQLEKERDRELAGINLMAMSQPLDWAQLFSAAGDALKDQMRAAAQEVRDYMSSDEFRSLDADSQREVMDRYAQLQEAVGGDLGSINFRKLGKDMKDFQEKQKAYVEAVALEKRATDELAAAQEEYNHALETGDTEMEVETKLRLGTAEQNAKDMSEAVKKADEDMRQAGAELKAETDSTVTALNGLGEAVSGLKSGSLSGMFTGLTNLGDSLSSLGGLLGPLGGAISSAMGGIAAALGGDEVAEAVFALLDMLKEGFGQMFADMIDTVMQAMNGVLGDLFSGDIVMKPLESLKDGLEDWLDIVSFGAGDKITGIFTGGDSGKKLMRENERLRETNERLTTAVDRLREAMNENGTSVKERFETYEKAMEAQQRLNDNARKVLRNDMAYSHAHHSTGYNWNLSDEYYNDISDLTGLSVRSLDDILSLSEENLDRIRTYLPDVWQSFMEQGEYAGRWEDDWNKLADQAEKTKEITDALNESLTGVSFDGLYDEFLNTLMDMTSEGEDFAKNFEKMLQKSMIGNMVMTGFKARIEAFHKMWAEAYEGDNAITYTEAEKLKAEYRAMSEEMVNQRDAMMEVMGWSASDSEAEGSFRNASSVSEETMDELNGRMTVIQVHTSELAQSALAGLQTLYSLSALSGERNTLVAEMRDMLFMSNSYLEDIAADTRRIYKEFGVKLDSVVSNTNRL